MHNDKMYKRHEKGYWKNEIETWKESGLTQSEYCRQKNIPISSFSNWKSKFHKKGLKKSDFVELKKEYFESGYIEFIVDDFFTYKVRDNISSEALRTLLLALRGL